MSYNNNNNRVEILTDLTLDEANEIKCIEKLKYIQISKDITQQALKIINSVILSERQDIQFRVYGFYNIECDLKFLKFLTNITDLSIGEMDSVQNIDTIGVLSKMKKLRIYLNKLDDISFLERVTPNITSLMLGTGINNSKINFNIVERFQFLKSLFLYKINYGFDSLKNMESLTNLTINASKIKDFTFLNNTNIGDLSLGMISNNDCTTLSGNTKIKNIELWKINKLLDLNVLLYLPYLERARIYQNNSIERIPDLSTCVNIKTLIFDELKNLKDISQLAYVPNIESIEFYQTKLIDFTDIENVLKNPSIKNFICKTGSVKKDKLINDLIKNNRKM